GAVADPREPAGSPEAAPAGFGRVDHVGAPRDLVAVERAEAQEAVPAADHAVEDAAALPVDERQLGAELDALDDPGARDEREIARLARERHAMGKRPRGSRILVDEG